MFRLAPVASFWRTVTVNVPDAASADAFDRQSFRARFRVLTPDEGRDFDARRRRMSADELAADPHALLREIVIGWDDVLDGEGRPLAFGAGALTEMLALPWVAPALLDAWRAGLAGEPRLGN